MDVKRRRFVVVLIALAALSSMTEPALPSDPAKPELLLSLEVRKEGIVKDPAGNARVEWQEAKESRPGDTLMYTITYRNAGKAGMRTARIVDPVPEGTRYLPGSAGGRDAAVTYSIDGKNFREASQLKYKVLQPGGGEILQTATPEMYTHVQWKLLKPLPAGGTGTVSFKVKVQ